MKAFLLNVVLCLVPMFYYHSSIHAQSTNNQVNISYQDEDKVYEEVDEMASFPGGLDELQKWIDTTIHHSQVAINKKIKGKIKVEFIVTKEGITLAHEIKNDLGQGTSQDLLDRLYEMPKWEPAMIQSKPVHSRVTYYYQYDYRNAKKYHTKK